MCFDSEESVITKQGQDRGIWTTEPTLQSWITQEWLLELSLSFFQIKKIRDSCGWFDGSK